VLSTQNSPCVGLICCHPLSYWVCEKSDGIRILLLIIPFPDGQEVYVVSTSVLLVFHIRQHTNDRLFKIDRKNIYRQLQGMFFPHYANKTLPLGYTLIDGELILDKDPASGAVSFDLHGPSKLFC
jgi:mRNA guanylyltransferase